MQREERAVAVIVIRSTAGKITLYVYHVLGKAKFYVVYQSEQIAGKMKCHFKKNRFML